MDIDLDYTMKFSDCLFKYVNVKTPKSKQVQEGWLKSIDPPTGNVILVTLEENSLKVKNITYIMKEEYEDISVLKEVNPQVKSVLLNLFNTTSPELEMSLPERKKRLVAWIKHNRLPVKINEKSIVVCGAVTILPPYTADSCTSTNGRVLMYIRDMVDKLHMATEQTAYAKNETVVEDH